MTKVDDATLKTWALSIGALALRELAFGMPYLRESKQAEVVAWLMEYRRDELERSYRMSTGRR